MRVATYCRVSTTEQNLDSQSSVIGDRLAREGWDARPFVDEGYSGDTVNRPRFKVSVHHGRY